MEEIDLEGLAHEIWATAQLIPGEGIEDGVSRVFGLLIRDFKKPPNKVNRPDACEHEWKDCPPHWSWCRECDIIDK